MNMKRAFAFILVLVLSISIFGCGMASDSEDTVVAKVNGEKISKGEFNALYDQIKQRYYITEEIENDPEQKEMIDELKAGVLEQLITEKLIDQNTTKAGFVVTDDTINEARVEFENIIAEVAKQMEEMDKAMQEEEEGETGDSQDGDYLNEAKAYIEGELNAIGQTQDEYIEILAKQMVIDEYIQDMVKDVEADDQEIQAHYEESLQRQKENIAVIPYEVVRLYMPKEVRVKHVLVKLPQDEIDEYNTMVAEGKEEEAEKYLNEKLKAIEPKAEEVLEKARSGEVFEELIRDYGEDPGMENNDLGYVVRQDNSFVPEFEEAAFKLEEGEISDLVTTSFGYHIIKLYDRNPEKVYLLEEKYEEVKEAMDQEKKMDAWMLILEEWLETAEIKRYEKRL